MHRAPTGVGGSTLIVERTCATLCYYSACESRFLKVLVATWRIVEHEDPERTGLIVGSAEEFQSLCNSGVPIIVGSAEPPRLCVATWRNPLQEKREEGREEER